jgi:hypothetical protein
MLPVWFASVWILDSRGAVERAVVVVALLVGVGFDAVLLPLLRDGERIPGTLRIRLSSRPHRTRALLGLLLLLAGAVASCLSWEGSHLVALSPDERAAMAWTRSHVPPSARFVVVTDSSWADDYIAEWFPALTGRVSVNTVQGSEWIPGGFARKFRNATALQRCAVRTSRCVDRWLARSGERATYVFVARRAPYSPAAGGPLSRADCCSSLRRSLDRSAGYHRIFSDAGASIYVRE